MKQTYFPIHSARYSDRLIKTLSALRCPLELAGFFISDHQSTSTEQSMRPDITHISGGLTKRELFAAMAMQGLLANGYSGNPHVIKTALEYADALLKELEK